MIFRTVAFLFAWMGVLVLGCAETDAGDDDDSAEAVGDDDDDTADALDGFFSLATIHDISIEVSDAGVENLSQEPTEYTRADVTIDGSTYLDVGIRLKGAAGSFIISMVAKTTSVSRDVSWARDFGRN